MGKAGKAKAGADVLFDRCEVREGFALPLFGGLFEEFDKDRRGFRRVGGRDGEQEEEEATGERDGSCWHPRLAG